MNDTPTLGKVRQVLDRYDTDELALAYEMLDTLPPPFTRIRNDWAIEALGDGRSRLVGTALFEMRAEAAPMKDKIAGKMGMAMEVFAQSLRDHLQG